MHFCGLTSCYRLHDGGKLNLVGAQLSYGWKQYDEVSGDVREESESFEVECESKKCTLEQRHMAITLSAGRFGVENRWPEQSDGERLAW